MERATRAQPPVIVQRTIKPRRGGTFIPTPSEHPLCHPFGVLLDIAPIPGVPHASHAHPRLFMCRPIRGFALHHRATEKAPKGRHIYSRGWSAQRARNPRISFKERTNPEGVAHLFRRHRNTHCATPSGFYWILHRYRGFRMLRMLTPGYLCVAPFGALRYTTARPNKPRRGGTIIAGGGARNARATPGNRSKNDQAPKGWHIYSRRCNAKPRRGGTFIAGGGACKACGTPGISTKEGQTPKGWHIYSDAIGTPIVPPLRGSIGYCTDTGGSACFACSPPAIYVSPHSGLCATPPRDRKSPEGATHI